MATTTTLYAKSGELVEALAPSTTAAQVAVNDANGAKSNVEAEIIDLRKKVASAVDAGVRFKGTLTKNAGLPTVGYKAGWQYSVQEAGTYAGVVCEVGDLVVCIKDYASGSASNSDWNVLQANIVGAVTGPSSSVANHIAVFDGVSGKVIKDGGFTVGRSVPADAVFTDTTYAAATDAADGLLTAALHKKLVGVEEGADKTNADNVGAAGAFMKATDTADSLRDGATKVVMTAEERAKLGGIASSAEVNQNAWSKVKVGSTTLSAMAKTDTLELAAGEGITMSASGKKVTIGESYIDSCVVTSLDDVPANLRNGGLVILKG